MAGHMDPVQLKSIPRCNHGIMCVLKTGTSKNANHGKSFFICNSTKDRCAFAVAAKDFDATVCPNHEKMVELKAFARKENGIRCYYRCLFGKEKGETWCGHELIQPTKQQKSVLKDITNVSEKGKDTLISRMSRLHSTNNIINNQRPVSSDITRNTAISTTCKSKEIDLPAAELPVDLAAKEVSKETTGMLGKEGSMIDLSRSSFTVPRNARTSDISDVSSVDSSHLSKNSHNDLNDDNDAQGIVENNSIVDSSMLSNRSDCNEDSSDRSMNNITESCSDNIDRETNKSNKETIVSDSDLDSDDSDHEEESDHVPQDTVIDSSMVSNFEDDLAEITDSLLNTSIRTAVTSNVTSTITTSSSNNNETTEKSAHLSSFFHRSSTPAKNSNTVISKSIPKRTQKSNIIEISDSSDDDTEVTPSVRPKEIPLPQVHMRNDKSTCSNVSKNTASLPPPPSLPPPSLPPPTVNLATMSANMCVSKIHSIKVQIQRQQDIYARMGRVMPDGGRKLIENISALTRELETVKKQYVELQKVPRTHGSMAMNVHYPTLNNDGSVQYTHPHHGGQVDGYGQYRPAPLFGGRMTEKRLKEVGTITKDSIENLHKSLESRPSPTEEAEDPKGLKVTLMTHQKQAIAWLMWREQQTPPGGILADDMGLGKTLTMISLALKSKQDDVSQIKEVPKDSKLILSKGSVIICPASLIHQWQKEVEKRLKDSQLSVYVYHGQSREKRVKKLAKYDIVLTTYNIASIEGKKFSIDEKAKPQTELSEWLDSTQPKVPEEGPLFKIFWRRIILDEGHTIKNHKTACSIAICAMEGESRWIVTGTPIQNNTMELYSLIKFLRINPFDELKVWRREVDNKMTSGTKRMNSIVASILLRRTKDQTDSKTGKPLIALPKRTAILHKQKLSKGELAVYELVQHYSKKVFKKFLDTRKDADDSRPINPTEHQENETYDIPEFVLGIKAEEALSMLGLHGANVVTQGCLLVLVLRLRQCCTHLSLMCEEIDPELCKSEGIEVPLEESFGNLSIDENAEKAISTSRPKEMYPTFLSSKISTLLSTLSELRKESSAKPVKSVIVSQWTRMLEIVAYHLKVAGYKFEFITGSVNVKKRSDLVESFNNEKYPEIMLVSLKAGGVGLNLIGGSQLFLLDQHWNPALEDQAADRIYRVGQKNDVVVHKFLCTDTVEERIAALQEKKKALADSVLYGGKQAQKLTLADLKMIFGLGT